MDGFITSSLKESKRKSLFSIAVFLVTDRLFSINVFLVPDRAIAHESVAVIVTGAQFRNQDISYSLIVRQSDTALRGVEVFAKMELGQGCSLLFLRFYTVHVIATFLVIHIHPSGIYTMTYLQHHQMKRKLSKLFLT